MLSMDPGPLLVNKQSLGMKKDLPLRVDITDTIYFYKNNCLQKENRKRKRKLCCTKQSKMIKGERVA
jgi:hypothetical protein